MDVQPNYYCWLPLKRCTRQPLLISAQFHLISGSIPVSVLEERGRESNSDSDSDPFSERGVRIKGHESKLTGAVDARPNKSKTSRVSPSHMDGAQGRRFEKTLPQQPGNPCDGFLRKFLPLDKT